MANAKAKKKTLKNVVPVGYQHRDQVVPDYTTVPDPSKGVGLTTDNDMRSKDAN